MGIAQSQSVEDTKKPKIVGPTVLKEPMTGWKAVGCRQSGLPIRLMLLRNASLKNSKDSEGHQEPGGCLIKVTAPKGSVVVQEGQTVRASELVIEEIVPLVKQYGTHGGLFINTESPAPVIEKMWSIYRNDFEYKQGITNVPKEEFDQSQSIHSSGLYFYHGVFVSEDGKESRTAFESAKLLLWMHHFT